MKRIVLPLVALLACVAGCDNLLPAPTAEIDFYATCTPAIFYIQIDGVPTPRYSSGPTWPAGMNFFVLKTRPVPILLPSGPHRLAVRQWIGDGAAFTAADVGPARTLTIRGTTPIHLSCTLGPLT